MDKTVARLAFGISFCINVFVKGSYIELTNDDPSLMKGLNTLAAKTEIIFMMLFEKDANKKVFCMPNL